MADSTNTEDTVIEINHLRKAEPIQLSQILNKCKTLKNSQNVLSIMLPKSEAKFDKLNAKKRKTSIPYLLDLPTFYQITATFSLWLNFHFRGLHKNGELSANVFNG